MTRLEKLMLRVELIDKVTAPATKMLTSIEKITDRVKLGFKDVATGITGIFASGFGLNKLTQQAREMNNALGDVRSLGVAEAGLRKLEKRALSFSITYGEGAIDFVRSAYDIWGAIPGLADNELADFTEAAGLLAKGAKADAENVANFMGTMYGIFEDQANEMGRSRWIEQMAGQTAKAVDIFKTSGREMGEAWSSLGAGATVHGIPMHEQMAVLGKLQAVMKSGAVAGSAYSSFLANFGKAEGVLGTKLTDSNGNMLGIVDVLRILEEKFGHLSTVDRSNLFSKAFGRPAVAMINNLMGQIGNLENEIATIGATPGMDDLRWMVDQMIDPLEQLTQASTAVRISFGKVINAALLPFYQASTKGLSTLNRWVELFPNLSSLVAKLTIFVFAFTAAISALLVIKGLYIITAAGMTTALAILRFAMLPFAPLLAALRMGWLMLKIQMAASAGLLPALRLAFLAFNTQLLINLKALWLVRAATWLMTATMGFLRVAVLATAISFPGLITGLIAMKAMMLSAATGAWAFTAALLANPITWIVLGVVALIAGLVLLVTHWDAVKAAAGDAIGWIVEKWAAFKTLLEDNALLKFLFFPLTAAVSGVDLLLTSLEKIPAWFASFKTWLANLNPFDVIQKLDASLVNLLNKIPGINISGGLTTSINPPVIASSATSLDDVSADPENRITPQTVSHTQHVPTGGLRDQITNTSASNIVHVEKMEFHSAQPTNGFSIYDELQMAGG